MQVKVDKNVNDCEIFRERTNHYLRFRMGDKTKYKEKTFIADSNVRVHNKKPVKCNPKSP